MALLKLFVLCSVLLSLVPTLAFTQSSVHPTKLDNSPTLLVNEPGSWRRIQKGIEFRKVAFVRTEPYHPIGLKMVRFDMRWIVPHIVQSVQYNLKASNVKSLAEKSGAVAAINANYFDEMGKPLGYLKSSNGKPSQRISRSSLFNGIFGIKDLRPFIMKRDDFAPQDADEGLQAGPLLLIQGKVLAVTRGAGKQSRRSLIGIDKDQRLIIAATDNFLGGLTWVEIQEFFTSKVWQIETPDLLNLDGGGSTQLYFKGTDFKEHVPGAVDVPVAIGLFPRPE